MKLETGKPLIEGLYLAFVPSVSREWLEPHIVMWRDNRWHHRWRWGAQSEYPDQIFYWTGPIPVVSNPEESDLDFDL